jgi:hypothetical protein
MPEKAGDMKKTANAHLTGEAFTVSEELRSKAKELQKEAKEALAVFDKAMARRFSEHPNAPLRGGDQVFPVMIEGLKSEEHRRWQQIRSAAWETYKEYRDFVTAHTLIAKTS